MDVKHVQSLLVKNRSQLIDEFKGLKPEPYVTFIKTVIVFTVMALVNNYFSGPITDKMAAFVVVAGGFIVFEILFVLDRMEKKINLLFELGKIKEVGTNGDAISEEK